MERVIQKNGVEGNIPMTRSEEVSPGRVEDSSPDQLKPSVLLRSM